MLVPIWGSIFRWSLSLYMCFCTYYIPKLLDHVNFFVFILNISNEFFKGILIRGAFLPLCCLLFRIQEMQIRVLAKMRRTYQQSSNSASSPPGKRVWKWGNGFQNSQDWGVRRWDEMYTDNSRLNYGGILGWPFGYSFTQSFADVFLYYTRMLWASSPPRMEGETYLEGWPGNCGEACSWLSHRFPFSLSTSSLSLSVKGHGGGEEGEKTINGHGKKNRPNWYLVILLMFTPVTNQDPGPPSPLTGCLW